MTKTEREICERTGTDPSDYLRAKRARRGGLSVNVAGSPYTSGGRGQQCVAEAGDAMRNSEPPELPRADNFNVGARALLAEARDMLAAAIHAAAADENSDAVWQQAARAGAFIEAALDRSAPAFANRDTGTNEDAEDGPYDAPQTRLARRVGAAVERVLAPVQQSLQAIGGPRPLGAAGKLTAVELAVCHNTGTSPEEFLANKARRGLMVR